MWYHDMIYSTFADIPYSSIDLEINTQSIATASPSGSWEETFADISQFAGNATPIQLQFYTSSYILTQYVDVSNYSAPLNISFWTMNDGSYIILDHVIIQGSPIIVQNSTLTLEDGSDIGVEYVNSNVGFYANYRDDGFNPINTGNTQCSIYFNRFDSSMPMGPYLMSYNAGSYEYFTRFDAVGLQYGPGNHFWNVTCTDPGYFPATTTDTVNISQPPGDMYCGQFPDPASCSTSLDCYWFSVACYYNSSMYCSNNHLDNGDGMCDSDPLCSWNATYNFCKTDFAGGGNYCTQFSPDQSVCDNDIDCMYDYVNYTCVYDDTTYCSSIIGSTMCNNDASCHWDAIDSWCRTNSGPMGNYCSQFSLDTDCNNNPNCFYNFSGSKCLRNESTFCSSFTDEPSCMIEMDCHWDYLDNFCYKNTWQGGSGDCFTYYNNETGCLSQESCEYNLDTGDCYYAPKCYMYDGDDIECMNKGCFYDYANSKCIMNFQTSGCYDYTNETDCIDSGYCKWDNYMEECFEDFGSGCENFETWEMCDQQPFCFWESGVNKCLSDMDAGQGSYCWEHSDNQTACQDTGGCMWFNDPMGYGGGWCDQLGLREECGNGIDDNDNGMCDSNGCTINGTELPPDPDCSFEMVYENIGYTVNSPDYGPNVNVNKINITFDDVSKVSSAWYTLNSLSEEYCDWWFDDACKDGDIDLTSNDSITSLGTTLDGEYELAIFVQDEFGIIQPYYIYLYSGSVTDLKPTIELLYPENNSVIPHEFTIDFMIDPKGMPKEINYSINGANKGSLPGMFFHYIDTSNVLFPTETQYTVAIYASNDITSATVTYVFTINDSEAIFIDEANNYFDETENLFGDKFDLFGQEDQFTEDEYDVVELMGIEDIIAEKKALLDELNAELANETNTTIIQELKDQIDALKAMTPGEVTMLSNMDDALQNVEGAYIDSVIRNFMNQTNLTIDLAQTQDMMKNLTEIRKEGAKVEVRYLDGTVKNVTKITEKLVANDSTNTKQLNYLIHDEILPNVNLSTATRTILLPDGTALIEINKNITGQNNLNLCLVGDSCGSSNLSNINTSLIDMTGNIEFTIIKSDPIVKWSFQASSTPSTPSSPSGSSGGGGGGSKNAAKQAVNTADTATPSEEAVTPADKQNQKDNAADSKAADSASGSNGDSAGSGAGKGGKSGNDITGWSIFNPDPNNPNSGVSMTTIIAVATVAVLAGASLLGYFVLRK